MADDYTNTAEHRIPVPAITDDVNFTSDITNLRTRLNKGLAGTAAYNVDGTNYVLAAANAGALLSRGGGYPRGSVIGAASGEDPYVTLYTNTGAALVGEWSIGADDSDTDKLMFSTGTDLSAPKMTLTEGGALGIGVTAPTASHLLDVGGNVIFKGSRNSQSHNDGIRVNKASVARLATAVVDVTLAHCRVTFDIYVGYTASGNLTWQGEITATINSTNLGTTGTMVVHHDGSAGVFVVVAGDFVVTRPGGDVIRLTYTNNDSAGADPNSIQVSARVFTQSVNVIPTISVT